MSARRGIRGIRRARGFITRETYDENTVVYLALFALLSGALTAPAYDSLKALVVDLEKQQADALRTYVAEHPDAADTGEAEDRLAYSLVLMDEFEEAAQLQLRRYERAVKDEKIEVRQLFGANIVPIMETYVRGGMIREGREFLDRVRIDLGKRADDPDIDAVLKQLGAELKLPSVGETIDVRFTALDGTEIDLSRMADKVVLLDFWATWCMPCMQDMPSIKALYEANHDKGFEIIGVSLDEEQADLEAVLKDTGITWCRVLRRQGVGDGTCTAVRHPEHPDDHPDRQGRQSRGREPPRRPACGQGRKTPRQRASPAHRCTDDHRCSATICVNLWATTVLALLTLSASAGPAEELALERAIELALLQNRDLAALRLELEGAAFGVDEAEAPFALTFRPDGVFDADQNSSRAELGLAAVQPFDFGGDVEVGARAGETERDGVDAEKRAAVRVQLDQPLFRNFGTLVNREGVVRARNEVKSARRRIELQKADLILQVVTLHGDVLRLQQRLVADEQNFKRFDQLYRLTRVREQQGRATRIDTLRAEFERGRAELSITSTTEELESRRRDLADLLALPLDTDLVARPGADLRVDATPPGEAVGIALSNRLDYAEAIQQLRDAARGVAIAGRQLLPDLNLIARYEKIGSGPAASDARTLDEEAWFVGFAGDTDVPQRGARAALGRSKIDEKSARQKLDILIRGRSPGTPGPGGPTTGRARKPAWPSATGSLPKTAPASRAECS